MGSFGILLILAHFLFSFLTALVVHADRISHNFGRTYLHATECDSAGAGEWNGMDIFTRPVLVFMSRKYSYSTLAARLNAQ